jgi:hypothetical protein
MADEQCAEAVACLKDLPEFDDCKNMHRTWAARASRCFSERQCCEWHFPALEAYRLDRGWMAACSLHIAADCTDQRQAGVHIGAAVLLLVVVVLTAFLTRRACRRAGTSAPSYQKAARDLPPAESDENSLLP